MKILIAEDDTLITKMYSTKLKSLGIDVVHADDGEKVIEIFKSEKPDFILLDIMLPKLSGLDALAEIRKLPNGKNIPVVILSNLSGENEKKQAEKFGVKDFIVKANLTPSEIINRITKYLPAKNAN